MRRCQIPSGYKIQRNTVGCIAAFSIWLDLCLLKKIFIASILDMKTFCSSKVTLKNNSPKQACCFWIKKISERWENNSSQKSRCKWDLCQLNKIFIVRIFRRQKVLQKTPRNLERLVLKSKHAVSAQEIFLERRKKLLAHFFGKINWSHQSLCMWTFAFNLSYGVSGINTHYSNKTSIKKIQSFDLKVELWVQ